MPAHLLIYTALVLARDAADFVIGGYLAFKVASKWEVWSHVYQIPQQMEGVDEFELLRLPHRRSDQIYRSFGHYVGAPIGAP